MVTTNKKTYDFGEKKEEIINGKKIPVEWITPKYKEAKNKAIELLESEKYKGVLETSDFWILVNTYSNKTKVMYSGLIISHDGCLKINDSLEDKLKFKPECMSLDKEGYNNSLVYTYSCPEQGLYEVGEVSKDNLKNGGYPYAMALKRCFDRVVLKNSKIAYSGIYSDSESDEFLKRTEEADIQNEEKPQETTNTKEETTKTKKVSLATEDQVKRIKAVLNEEKQKEICELVGKAKIEDFTVNEASKLLKSFKVKKKESEK